MSSYSSVHASPVLKDRQGLQDMPVSMTCSHKCLLGFLGKVHILGIVRGTYPVNVRVYYCDVVVACYAVAQRVEAFVNPLHDHLVRQAVPHMHQLYSKAQQSSKEKLHDHRCTQWRYSNFTYCRKAAPHVQALGKAAN